ncbi:hypothetical protein CspeluHIS016_0406510 [Cutaneotrichosporon spelunceum]|uniref:Uncharacterized protein n=1 Tax=Cutaneotrichosporon spelunceum TaxID=1672016 RepID=A0AAD3YDC7_9TREE|nr:hypothetical protein CspeluHIS016_0406510 [Cutaneotrichosporon spelunceum]
MNPYETKQYMPRRKSSTSNAIPMPPARQHTQTTQGTSPQTEQRPSNPALAAWEHRRRASMASSQDNTGKSP